MKRGSRDQGNIFDVHLLIPSPPNSQQSTFISTHTLLTMIYNLIGLAALLTQILASPISTEDGIVLTTPSITLCSESESGDVTIHGSTDGLIDSYLGVPFAAPRERHVNVSSDKQRSVIFDSPRLRTSSGARPSSTRLNEPLRVSKLQMTFTPPLGSRKTACT